VNDTRAIRTEGIQSCALTLSPDERDSGRPTRCWPDTRARGPEPHGAIGEFFAERNGRLSTLRYRVDPTDRRYANGLTVQCLRLPDEPNAQIEHGRGVRQKGNDLPLDGNAVLVDLVAEGLTEHDEVLSA
jgi:hypothetical protein